MASVGTFKQILLEKWEQVKVDGNLTDEMTETYALYAEAERTGGSRTYQQNQLQMTNTVRFKIRYRSEFDIDATWKIVYDGRRHSVQSIEKLNERNFDYLIVAESKGVAINIEI